MELGLLLPVGGGRWDKVAQVASEADAAGFDVLWVGDHLQFPPGAQPLESMTVLAALAGDVRATLAIATAAVAFRPAPVFAKAVTTLHQVAGGRIRCLLGAGADEAEHAANGLPFGSPRERLDRLVDYARVCRTLWSTDGPVDHVGPAGPLRGAVHLPKPASPIDLGFGGGGRRVVRLAATTGSELCIGLRPEFEDIAASFRHQATEAGRRPRLTVLVPYGDASSQHPLAAHPRNLDPRDLRAGALAGYARAGVTGLYLVPLGAAATEAAIDGLDELRTALTEAGG